MLEDLSFAKAMLRRLCFFVTIVPLAAALLSACIVSPIYTQISADVTYVGSVLPDILSYIVLLLDIIFASAQYASVIIAFILFPASSSRRAVRLICIGATVTRCMLNLLASVITDGADFVDGLPVTALYIALETLQLYLVVLISWLVCGEAVKRFSLLRAASRRLGSPGYNWAEQIYPYHKIFSKSNPLQKSAALASAVYSVLLIISRLIYDFSYGAPQNTSEILQMIAGYSTDILSGIFVYGLILLFSFYFFRMLSRTSENTTPAK